MEICIKRGNLKFELSLGPSKIMGS
jgi:hypothetical protein